MNRALLIGIFSILLLFPALAFAQKSKNTSSTEVKFPESGAFSNSNLTYKIISSPNKTFGYDIFSDGKLLIHQPTVPGMPGNEGFKTSASGEKVATLVIKKIKNGEMPPTVTVDEMKKLKAIK